MAQYVAGRSRECKIIENCLVSPESEFIVVSGRRRIGKTYLINNYLKDRLDFIYVGSHNARTEVQLSKFAKALSKHSGSEEQTFKSWYAAFDALENYLDSLPKKRKKVIFIDEMPWIDRQRSLFVNALEAFWNSWANLRNDIVLIASGSATSWMADYLFSNKGGLHNRITQRLYLKPFTLGEAEEYILSKAPHWQRYDITQIYMLTGGVPYYLSLFNYKQSVAQNIDNLCFDPDGPLRGEFFELYHSLFANAESYVNIVKALYNHKQGLMRKEISAATQLSGAFLTKVLRNLELCGFIKSKNIYNKKNALVYRLVDYYTLFYLKFIADKNKLDRHWWSHHINDNGVKAWQGLTFELICMQHSEQIKKALGISGVATEITTWRCATNKEKETPGAQVDMVIERADKFIHLCEIKFAEGKFNITKEYEEKLRDRMDIFRKVTKTRKQVITTFITSFGLDEGKNHSIVHSEVNIDELFYY